MAISLVWFKRDLRLQDHQPLADAIMDANEEHSSAGLSSIWWFAAAVVLVAVIAGWWLA